MPRPRSYHLGVGWGGDISVPGELCLSQGCPPFPWTGAVSGEGWSHSPSFCLRTLDKSSLLSES